MKRHWMLFCLGVAVSAAFSGNEELEGLLEVRSYPGPVDTPNQVLIKNATIWTQDKKGTLKNQDLLIEDGKIKKIGKNLRAGKLALVIDASGKHVTPGMIDAHSHSATAGRWAEGVNEMGQVVTAQVRIKDILSPKNTQIYRELAGGLTTANLLHGSANPIGGQNAVHKLRWGAATAEEMLFKAAPQGIKFALGENPKRVHDYPDTRMGVMMIIQNAFTDAEAYTARWDAYNALSDADKEHTRPPRRNLQHEAIAEILAGTRLIHSHGYRQDEFLALLRLTQEKGVRIATLQHVLEGYKIADEIAKAGVGASTFSDWWSYKVEAYDAIPYNAALMQERGVLVSVNSDDAGLARRMNLEAAKSVRYGAMSPVEALNLVTINPAKQLRIDKRTGSLVKGKDADVVIWNGDPLQVSSRPDYTFVDGIIRFSRERDLAHRTKVEESRAKLIELIKKEGKKKKEKQAKKDDKPVAKKDEAVKEEKKQAKEGDKPDAKKDKPKKKEKKPEVKPNPDSPVFPYQLSPLAPAETTAIVGALVHTMAGEAISKGIVVIQNGKIVAVGDANTPVPDGAKVYDAKGKHLWPGMIHAASHLGLHEIGAVNVTVDHREEGKWNPELVSHISVNPDSAHIPVARSAGITHTVVLPGSNMVSGIASLIKTDGWTWEELTAVKRISLIIGWPEGGRKKSLEERIKGTEKKIKEFSDFFDNAEHYRKAKQEAGKKPFKTNAKYEAMLPVLAGDIPLYVIVSRSWAIKKAHEWASERGLRMVVLGGGEADKIADYLVKYNIPVVLTSSLFNPRFADDPYDSGYSLPSKLAKAGVLFAIAGAAFESETIRNVIEHAGLSTAYGLSKEDAYRSLTLNPAKIFGLDKSLGSIEAGKIASLVLTEGDLLEVSSVVKQVWIDGIQCDMNDKQKRLYERYRARPKAK